MPELPEVETTRRGILPHLEGRTVTDVVLRRPDLRWPIPYAIVSELPGQTIRSIERRGKYLLLHTDAGSALLHLGMSGVLRVLPAETPVGRHDHVDLLLETRPGEVPQVLRFTDPRRFGCLLWQPPGEVHELLARLGPEPLTEAFHGDVLWRAAQKRQSAVKLMLMDNAVVVGVGNIYANEALFAAGIDPRRAAASISRPRYRRLASEIQRILAWAIERGGTTLRDFISPDGKPGYFFRELMVYDRAGEACTHCGQTIQTSVLGQRATYWCPRCQR
ncbi:bifunctional DNA-formamidopyrimidine glycosylase/DNA-(apurinic or apyrimidinic site) lyase [Frateuria aurantia]